MNKPKVRVIFFLFAFILLFPNLSQAHTYVVRSSPAQNQQLDAAVSKVTIQFDENIQPAFLVLNVYDESGHRVDTNNAHLNKKNPSILENQLKKSLPNGFYQMQWKVISADGHPVSGVIPFQIGHEKHGKAQNIATNADVPHADNIVIRWLFYSGLALDLGILIFFSFIYVKTGKVFNFTGKAVRIGLWAAAAALLSAVLLSLPLQVTLNAGVSWLQSLQPSYLYQTLSLTSFGLIWYLQLVLLVLLIVTTLGILKARLKNRRYFLWPLIILTLLLILSKTFAGHAVAPSSIGYRALAIAADFLHMTSASIWIGSLVCILAFLPKVIKEDFPSSQRKAVYWRTIRRFSPFAAVLVLLLILSGVISSIVHLPNVRSLYTSTYGRLIIIKSVLLFVMLLLGLSHFIRGRRKRDHDLKKSLIAELGIGVAVLFAAAILTNVAPPTPPIPKPALQSQTSSQSSSQNRLPPQLTVQNRYYHTKAGGYTIYMKIAPLKAGYDNIFVHIKKGQKQATDLQQVVLTIASLDMDMGKLNIQVPLNKSGKAAKVKGVFSMQGNYQVHVHALNKTFDDIDTDFICIIN